MDTSLSIDITAVLEVNSVDVVCVGSPKKGLTNKDTEITYM